MKLYEQQNKPDNAVKFIRKNLCEECPDEEQFEILVSDLERSQKKICELERELSRLKGNIKRSSSEVDLALKKGFEELNADADNITLLKKFLTQAVIDELKEQKTMYKGTLLDVIQSGLELLQAGFDLLQSGLDSFPFRIGAFACDPDAYTTFATLFNPLIEEIHGFKCDDKQPDVDFGTSCDLPKIDLNEDRIISIRMQCRRNVEGFPFTPIMTMEQHEEIMAKVQTAANCMCGDLSGKFHPLEAMDKDFKRTLIDSGVMFKENSEVLKAANATRFWPTGRGIFVNESSTFVVRCNEGDHLRFISTEQGGDLSMKKLVSIERFSLKFFSSFACLGSVYDRMVTGMAKFSKDIVMCRDERLGFLTFSPANLGNTITVSIRMKLEKLPQKEVKIDEFAGKFYLKISKLNDDNIYEVTSKKRLGVTEFQTVNSFAEAVLALIDAENSS